MLRNGATNVARQHVVRMRPRLLIQHEFVENRIDGVGWGILEGLEGIECEVDARAIHRESVSDSRISAESQTLVMVKLI